MMRRSNVKVLGIVCIVLSAIMFFVLACIGICSLFGGIGVAVFVAIILLVLGIACVNSESDFNPFHIDDDDYW